LIGHLRGELVSKQPPLLLVDVQGVGYEVDAPMSTFFVLPEPGQQVTLLTHLVVREDAHTLYGFATDTERRLFRTLIKVNGVGAKLALTILSGISVDDFCQCIHADDVAALTRLPGVGKKTAERLIVEMRDRLSDWQTEAMTSPSNASGAAATQQPVDAVSEAVSALIALGYKAPEASRMVRDLDTSGMSSETIIRQALQVLVRN